MSVSGLLQGPRDILVVFDRLAFIKNCAVMMKFSTWLLEFVLSKLTDTIVTDPVQ